MVAGGGVAAYFLWLRPGPDDVLPAPGSALYDEYLRAFQVGVAALDTGEAETHLAIRLGPEPLGRRFTAAFLAEPKSWHSKPAPGPKRSRPSSWGV